MELKVIGHIETDFPEKFGIPRQSGLVPQLRGKIVLEPEYRQEEAFRGIEEFSHLWLVWDFSKNHRKDWTATVRPPRLGGKVRMGVFATRSSFRPNAMGLSVVKLERVELSKEKGPVLYVSGVDMLSGTPIYDIKPYLPYVDAIADASAGFGGDVLSHKLSVEFSEKISEEISKRLLPEKKEEIVKLIEQDPRTAFIEDPERIWGITYGNYNVRFVVKDEKALIVEITDIGNTSTGNVENFSPEDRNPSSPEDRNTFSPKEKSTSLTKETIRKLAVFFPGIGYRHDRPLLYYSEKLALEKGYELCKLDYGEDIHSFKGRTKKELEPVMEKALERIYPQLAAVKWEQYQEVLFVGKSIGTAIGARVAELLSIRPKQFIMTPVPATVAYIEKSDCVFVAGTSDPYLSAHELAAAVHRNPSKAVLILEECNHSMEKPGETMENLERARLVMERLSSFMDKTLTNKVTQE